MTRPTPGDRRSRLLSAAAALGLILFGTPANAQQKPVPAQQVQDPLERLNESIDALTKKVWPSVVQIQVTAYGAREDNTRGDANVVIGQQRSVRYRISSWIQTATS